LSSEEEYNIEQDLENVLTYGYLINSPCSLTMLIKIYNFLSQDECNAIEYVNTQRGPATLIIPSQTRYVYCYENLLRQEMKPMNTYQLVCLRV